MAPHDGRGSDPEPASSGFSSWVSVLRLGAGRARSTISIDIDDASDYFYLLRWPRARWEETLVGTAASASSLLQAGAQDEDGELARLGSTVCEWGLICPAMGDQKAAHASQAVHQHCLLQRGALLSEEWLTFGYRPPPGPHWHGIYQDDRVLLSVVPPRWRIT